LVFNVYVKQHLFSPISQIRQAGSATSQKAHGQTGQTDKQDALWLVDLQSMSVCASAPTF